MNWSIVAPAIEAFCFGYPFVMSVYWMVGGILFHLMRERHEPLPDAPPVLQDYPPVSILVPCYNEENHLEETFAALAVIHYPCFEIIAINDGSSDRTADVLESLAARTPKMRVINMAVNHGKSTALNTGALLAKHELLVCIDSDALLDCNALIWFVRRFQSEPKLGAITGNPRIRNRSSLLGRLQVGEFSCIIGLIKRAQTVYGRLFTVSGVVCAFRKQALHDAGWWAPNAITDDVDISWRIQFAGWLVVFEPKALCWILMPETLKGLWIQRLRWSEGGTRVVLDASAKVFQFSNLRLLLVWGNYIIAILWSYAILFTVIVGVIYLLGFGHDWGLPVFLPLPAWMGTVLSLTYFLQSFTSVMLDVRFERSMGRILFWVVWYPLVFWLLQAATAVVGLPRALLRSRHERGTWKSPDRGFK